jgi:uncharacterized SAM-binding protein YcdF (DUF218 family)
MFFILSKTLVFLLMPFTIVVILLVASVLIKKPKWKKRTFWIAFVMLIFFSNEFIANAVMRGWEMEARPFSSMRKYKVGIVLTGATIYGLQPNDRVYFHRGADRLIHTVQLYKLGLIEKILISGGVGRLVSEEEPESVKFKKTMLLMDIPNNDIIIESETRNTGESPIEVKKILDHLGYQAHDCLLITSAFHMRRSLLSYKKNGLELDSFSTDFYGHKVQFAFDDLFIPQVDAIVKWNKVVKEWVGVAAYKITGYI